jgi:hypothetical protein
MMALPAFFDRVYAAAGGVLSLSRDSLEKHLGDVCVGIELDPAWDAGGAAYAADLAVNMAGRLYGELNLRGSDAWVSSASSLAKAINPNVALSDRLPTVSLIIGNVRRNSDAIYIRSDGWVARMLTQPLEREMGPPNPLAAGMAAGLAISEVFRRVFRSHVPQRPFEDVSISLLDFSRDSGADEPLTSAAIGDIAFVGVGAVGNAAVSTLAQLSKLEGRVVLIDAQEIDRGNLQRYVLATSVHEKTSKVDLAADALAATGVRVVRKKSTLEVHADKDALPPVVAVSVDNIPTRRAVQALLPRVAINGWTSDCGLGASWHELGERGPCLACDYHPREGSPSQYDLIMASLGLARDRVYKLWLSEEGVTVEDLDVAANHLKVERLKLAPWAGKRIQDFYTSVVCGQVAMDLSAGRGPLEAVPLAHQSVMAGILMACEILKRTDASLRARAQPQAMVVWDNVLQPPPRRWTLVRARSPNCICQDEIYQRRYRAKWSLDRE